MANVAKCLGIIAGGTFLAGAGISGVMHKNMRKKAITQLKGIADQNGEVPVGGRNKNGDMWDGKAKVDDLNKDMKKKGVVSSLIAGAISAIATTAVAALTLLVKAKIK